MEESIKNSGGDGYVPPDPKLPKEHWEIEKLKAEIRLTEQKIANENKPKSFWDVGQERITALATIIGIAGGIWGVFSAIATYKDLQEQEQTRLRQASAFQFNDKMAAYVGQLSIDSLRDQSVVTLTYFGKDAIPILLYRLERSDTAAAEHIIRAIAEIEKIAIEHATASECETIREKVFDDAYLCFSLCNKENPGTNDLDRMYNYIALINRISIHPENVRDQLKKEIKQIKPEFMRNDLSARIDKLIWHNLD